MVARFVLIIFLLGNSTLYAQDTGSVLRGDRVEQPTTTNDTFICEMESPRKVVLTLVLKRKVIEREDGETRDYELVRAEDGKRISSRVALRMRVEYAVREVDGKKETLERICLSATGLDSEIPVYATSSSCSDKSVPFSSSQSKHWRKSFHFFHNNWAYAAGDYDPDTLTLLGRDRSEVLKVHCKFSGTYRFYKF